MALAALVVEISPMIQMHIINSFIVIKRWNTSSQRREKSAHHLRKSLESLPDSCFTNLNHRISFEKIVEANKTLIAVLVEKVK